MPLPPSFAACHDSAGFVSNTRAPFAGPLSPNAAGGLVSTVQVSEAAELSASSVSASFDLTWMVCWPSATVGASVLPHETSFPSSVQVNSGFGEVDANSNGADGLLVNSAGA